MKKKTRVKTSMARFKKRRSASRKSAARKGRSASKGVNPLMVIGSAMAYGAARQYLSQAVEPITSKVPLGSFADEAVFGTAGYFMAKKGKGIVKSIGLAMLTVEAASVGNQIINKAVPAASAETYEY